MGKDMFAQEDGALEFCPLEEKDVEGVSGGAVEPYGSEGNALPGDAANPLPYWSTQSFTFDAPAPNLDKGAWRPPGAEE